MSNSISKDEAVEDHARRLVAEYPISRVEILVRKNTVHTRAMPFGPNPIAIATGTSIHSALVLLEINLEEWKIENIGQRVKQNA